MSRNIDTTAARWAARVDRGSLSAEDQRALDAWLEADRRHLGAFARARAVSAHFDRAAALGDSFDPAAFEESGRTGFRRWRAPWVATGLAASLAAFALVLVLHATAGQYATRRGEVRLVPLADGSAITLNTDSKLAVAYSKAERKVELLAGEALFNVAKDRSRPFIVHAGDTTVRAVGTSFTVRRLAGQKIQVLVREGVVEITRDMIDVQPIRVSAETLAVAAPEVPMTVAPVPSPQIDRELAWQQGMISLDGRTLREAADEFARYNRIPIVIEDPEIAGRTVTGLFSANNPVGFARAVGTSLNLKVEVGPDAVRLSR
jgi:transmembrane sensor